MHHDDTPPSDPFLRMIRSQVDARRLAEFMASGQWTLGQITDALDAIDDKTKAVVFDFPGMVPTTLDSWRGIYAELAIGYADDVPHPTVQELLDDFKAADGATYEGWKGGMFTMDCSTPVWVNNPGEYDRIGIVGVYDGYQVVLQTAYLPD